MNANRSLEQFLAPLLGAEGVQKIPGFGWCVFKREIDLVKILRTNVRKSFGVDVIFADVGILSKTDFSKIESKGPIDVDSQPASLTVCPVMNFPQIMENAYFEGDMPIKKWITMVSLLFSNLPSSMDSVEALFGNNFYGLHPISRVPIFVNYLRSLIDFEGAITDPG